MTSTDNFDRTLLINSDSDNLIGRTLPLKNLQKVVVKVDPRNGTKYFLKDGKKFEILSQPKNVRSLIPLIPALSPITSTPVSTRLKTVPITIPHPLTLQQQLDESAIPVQSSVKMIGKNHQVEPKPKILIRHHVVDTPSASNKFTSKMLKEITKSKTCGRNDMQITNKEVKSNKIIDNLKYNVITMNSKSNKETMTELTCGESVNCQTDPAVKDLKDVQTQTDFDDASAPINDDFLKYLLEDSIRATRSDGNMTFVKMASRKGVEENEKMNFLMDLRRALTYDKSGNLPIHESVLQDNWTQVRKCCVVLRARQCSVNVLNGNRQSPLHLAMYNGVAKETVELLLNYGADLYQIDPDGNNAIHLAVEHEHPQLLHLLLDTAKKSKCQLDELNYAGMTPLILATINRSEEIVHILLENGADPNVQDAKSGRSALFHAAINHDVRIVQLLIDYNANPKIRSYFGTSPHDAMFEMDDVPTSIKSMILGREYLKHLNKKNPDDSNGNDGEMGGENVTGIGGRKRGGGRRAQKPSQKGRTSPPAKRPRKHKCPPIDINTVLECRVTEDVDTTCN